MRILHMIPDIGVANGVMSVILNYFKAMPDDIKFDVVYFHETERNRKADIEALGGEVFKISAPGLQSIKNQDMSNLFKSNPNRWSALHIHAPHFAVFIAPYAKRAGIDKIAVHCHSTWFSFKKENQRRNKLLFEMGKRLATQKFACGTDAGRFWYSDKDDFAVLANAVDCGAIRYNEDLRKQKRQELNIEDKFVVGHVGRTYSQQKNQEFIIRVFAKIKEQRDDAVLLLAGSVEDENPMLVQLAKELNVYDSCNFMGLRTDISQLLQAYDVFLFPSLWEGLPVAVVEAQASGLPIVMSDSVTNELCATDRVCTLSLTNDSVDTWAEKVLQMGKMPRIDTYQQMKQSGWDIFTEAKKLANYYKTGELK